MDAHRCGAGRELTPITLSDWVQTDIDLNAEHLNTLVTPDWVIKHITESLERNLRFGANIYRRYDEQFRDGGLFGTKIGSIGEAYAPTVKIMAPRATLLDAG